MFDRLNTLSYLHGNIVSFGLVNYSPKSFHLKSNQFKDNGIIYITPYSNPYQNNTSLMLVLTGTSEHWLRRTIDYIPFLSANLNGDYIILGNRSYGEIQAFGYWNNFWQFDPITGFIEQF